MTGGMSAKVDLPPQGVARTVHKEFAEDRVPLSFCFYFIRVEQANSTEERSPLPNVPSAWKYTVYSPTYINTGMNWALKYTHRRKLLDNVATPLGGLSEKCRAIWRLYPSLDGVGRGAPCLEHSLIKREHMGTNLQTYRHRNCFKFRNPLYTTQYEEFFFAIACKKRLAFSPRSGRNLWNDLWCVGQQFWRSWSVVVALTEPLTTPEKLRAKHSKNFQESEILMICKKCV